MKKIFFVTFTLVSFIFTSCAWSCTTTIVGKDASADGSVIISHSEDGLNDSRMVYVPAMDHKPGDKRAVFHSQCALGYNAKWDSSETRRMVTSDRGPGYDTKDAPLSRPLGYIPQVAHTYAYFDGNYGIMNEHQLSIGECTDKAKVHPLPEKGKRIFYSDELSRIALERCKTAREAVKLMGRLIEEYGYYGTGETLLVGDPYEGWVMEMCGYDMNGTGGVWVAKRVPDNHFFVAANQFRIREVIKDSEDMLFSENIFRIAEDKGWWNPADGALDWTTVYGDGEFHHPYYSLRRVWRAQSIVAPSLNLPAWVKGANTKEYPFTIRPDKKISVEDIFNIHRDNYEGTMFDLTKGLAAGPFGNPNRFEGQAEGVADKEGELTTLKGAFERPLNIYRCVYAYVNQSRSWLPDAIGGLTWFGPDRPGTSVLMPFYAGARDLPYCIQNSNILKFDRKSMWTAFNYVANYVMLKYNYMIKDLNSKRDNLEQKAFDYQPELEAMALKAWEAGDYEKTVNMLTEYSDNNADQVLDAWWTLSEDIYLKYNDGYLNTEAGIAQSIFYPTWWLKEVGYTNGPTSYERQPDNK